MIKILLPLILFLFSCNISDEEGHNSDLPDVEPPEPDIECTHIEQEPNGDYTLPDWAGTLPLLSPELICGNFHSRPGELCDWDWYWFPINQIPSNQVLVNFVVNSMHSQNISVGLYQTTLDPITLQAGLVFIGEWFTVDGYLEVLDYSVEYDFVERNDLYIKVCGQTDNPTREYPYTLEVWGY